MVLWIEPLAKRYLTDTLCREAYTVPMSTRLAPLFKLWVASHCSDNLGVVLPIVVLIAAVSLLG
jgi:hypothetical protein